MIYRSLGKTGLKVSVLSLGCLRFPNEEKASRIIEKCIELGINYFETCPVYNLGFSERWLASGLGSNRKKVIISTKSAPVENNKAITSKQVRDNIEASLKKLQTDYLDLYLCWSVNSIEQYQHTKQNDGWLEGVLKAKEEGLIKYIGISTHANPSTVHQMISDNLWEVIMLQYSTILQAFHPMVEYANKSGMGVLVMGPLAGGLLALSSTVLQEAFSPYDQITGAFKYVLSNLGVSSAISGMTSIEEVENNAKRINSISNELTVDYQNVVNKRMEQLIGDNKEQIEKLFCTGCRYCSDICPKDIGAYNFFKLYNMVMLKAKPQNPPEITGKIQTLINTCMKCGKCIDKCPQKINIPEHMQRVKSYFENSPRDLNNSTKSYLLEQLRKSRFERSKKE